MDEKTLASSPGSRYSFKEIIKTASVKIQHALQVRGCMSVQRLIKLVHEKDEIVQQALNRLVREGKVTSVLQGTTKYIYWIDSQGTDITNVTKEDR